MCIGLRSQILERVLLAEQPTRVVYLGDGRGDFCACTRLGPCDAILARSAYPDGRPAALLRLLAAESAGIQAATGPQSTAAYSPARDALPPPPSRALLEAVHQKQPESSNRFRADPANAMAGRSGDGAHADAAQTLGARCPQGCTTSDEQQLRPLAAGRQPELQPVKCHADRDGAVGRQGGQPPTDAVAQRRDHQNPEAGQQFQVSELQVHSGTHFCRLIINFDESHGLIEGTFGDVVQADAGSSVLACCRKLPRRRVLCGLPGMWLPPCLPGPHRASVPCFSPNNYARGEEIADRSCRCGMCYVKCATTSPSMADCCMSELQW